MYWSLVTVIPNTDHKVGKVLRDQGYDFHLFQHTETFFVLSRKMIRTVLTFPRYVFVPICKCWKITNLSDDIIGPVKIGEDIAQVPPGVVEGLSSACTNGDDILNSLSYDFTIKPGQRVVVTGEDNNLPPRSKALSQIVLDESVATQSNGQSNYSITRRSKAALVRSQSYASRKTSQEATSSRASKRRSAVRLGVDPLSGNCLVKRDGASRSPELGDTQMMTFTDEQWFKIPLALRQRWWKETDYGRAQPSDYRRDGKATNTTHPIVKKAN